MSLATINTIEAYNEFDFLSGQVFQGGVLTYTVVMVDNQLWTKDQDGYGGELKVEGKHDSFKHILECGLPLIQIK